MPKLRTSCPIKSVLFHDELEYGSITECAADWEARGKYTVRERPAMASRRAIGRAGVVARIAANRGRFMAPLQHIESIQRIIHSLSMVEALAAGRSKQ